MKFSHFAYNPNIKHRVAYDIPVYKRIHRHPVQQKS